MAPWPLIPYPYGLRGSEKRRREKAPLAIWPVCAVSQITCWGSHLWPWHVANSTIQAQSPVKAKDHKAEEAFAFANNKARQWKSALQVCARFVHFTLRSARMRAARVKVAV